eukprot:COSAG02_NODE_2197_length_9546_cov_12.648354_5_plen_147_part_00
MVRVERARWRGRVVCNKHTEVVQQGYIVFPVHAPVWCGCRVPRSSAACYLELSAIGSTPHLASSAQARSFATGMARERLRCVPLSCSCLVVRHFAPKRRHPPKRRHFAPKRRHPPKRRHFAPKRRHFALELNGATLRLNGATLLLN